MRDMTAADLRDMAAEVIAASIEIHRASRAQKEGEKYDRPTGPPWDEEIDDFIGSNPLLDPETMERLLDPGLLGYDFIGVSVSDEWLKEFQENLREWEATNFWRSGDLPWLVSVPRPSPIESAIWVPATEIAPGWLGTSPSYLLLAMDLIKQGRLLSDMGWKEFEELIGHLLEIEGWKVERSRGTKDGGIDWYPAKLTPH